MNIAIVGLGITGASVLIELLDSLSFSHFEDELSIDIFDDKARPGAGLPYQDDSDAALLNSHIESISLDPNNQSGMVDWIKKKYPKQYKPYQLVPRRLVGEYIMDCLKDYLADERVSLIKSRIEDLRVVDSKGQAIYHKEGKTYYRLFFRGRWQDKIYDAVFLTIGHPPYKDDYNLQGQVNYIHNPYPLKESLLAVKPGQKIAIVGTGLTALDVLRYLDQQYSDQIDISFYNRSQPFTTVTMEPVLEEDMPSKMDAAWQERMLAKHGGLIPLEAYLQTMHEDFEDYHIDYEQLLEDYGKGSVDEIRLQLEGLDENLRRYQTYLSGSIHHHRQFILNYFSQEDRLRYFRDYDPIFQHFFAKMPAEAMKLVINKLDAGQLTIHNDIKAIESSPHGKFAMILENGQVEVDVVINATGFQLSIEKAIEEDIFLKNLYQRNLIVDDFGRYLKVSWPQSQVINRPFACLDNLFILGMWVMGTQYPNNSASLNIDHGRRVVNHFLKRIL